MEKGFFHVPTPHNEPLRAYGPGSPERAEVQHTLAAMMGQSLEIPMYIGGEEVFTETRIPVSSPHNHRHILGHYARGGAAHVQQAISAALAAKAQWEALAWEHRAAIFLKAADLIAGPWRARMNAATMLAQSKNIYQAEIDAVAELADFFRFNVAYMAQIYQQQPESSPGIWNRLEYRPLEGFVFCLTPFNFTAIAGNLPASAALMGNVCVWKPAESQIYSAHMIMQVLREAGLPDGVINLIYVDGPTVGEVVFSHPDFAGIHFTGSTGVFQRIWKTIGENIHRYKSYPRIVGETGGKDFILVHPSAHVEAAAVAISRGAFEYQGQKCSAASRLYLPASLYQPVMDRVLADVATFTMGDPADFSHFINAVIDERAFDKIAAYIDQAKADPQVEVLAGGTYDKSVGYFIAPTILLTRHPQSVTMCEEIFGPVLTVYVYEDDQFEQTLELVDSTSGYALTGALFAQDRYVIETASRRLQHSAGNFYINDKPTGAVVGQQPFGGGRASGTNDKAGSYLNLLRWVSARTIKENFVPPVDYRYPFLAK
ncbi:MAG: L-glutamate gamma-semialdehyde dehydrogenase [Bacteroidia bacterium]|nr:L-glutamate gamma-semialdehyde dehydrogenase [Bacteroidia bacterium]